MIDGTCKMIVNSNVRNGQSLKKNDQDTVNEI